MFGYTVPNYSRLAATDLSTYRRYYCETCHQLKEAYGLMSTAMVNYDMTFNTLILDGITGAAVDFEGTYKGFPPCVLRRPGTDADLFRTMAGYTVILTKWELRDDEVDDPSLKTSVISFALRKAIRKAEDELREYDRKVGEAFGRLRRLEKECCTDAVLMGSTFGEGLAEPLMDIAGDRATPGLRDIFVWLTAAVYVMDAADDLEQDYRDGTYNPFLGNRERFVNREDFMKTNLRTVTGAINECMSRLQDSWSILRSEMVANRDVCDNIIYLGITESAKNAVLGTGSARLSVKNALDRRSERNASH